MGFGKHRRTRPCRPDRQSGPDAAFFGLESLEPRVLLDGAGPVFHTPLDDEYVFTSSQADVHLDIRDADGDAVTVTAVSDEPGLTPQVTAGNRYARLGFAYDGGASIGEIVIELFEQRSAPATERFITLATNHVDPDGTLDGDGTPFYTDVPVHRVIDDFMFQTGDAENGNGTGGSPLGPFDDVFHPDLEFDRPGLVGMANSGPDTNDSQFFITDVPTPHLNDAHMIFGEMVAGGDVYQEIITAPTDADDRPLTAIDFTGAEIFETDADATLSFVPSAGFAGTANVTVTVSDGQGNQTVRTIAVTYLGDRPTIADPGLVGGTTDQPIAFVPEITDDSSGEMDVTAATSQPGAAVSVGEGYEITVTPPAGFVGIMPVTISAVEAGHEELELTPSERTVLIAVQRDGDPQMVATFGAGADAPAVGTFLDGDRLYVAAGAGLQVYDVSDPAAPELLGNMETPGSVRDVRIADGIGYLTDDAGWFVSFDITDPAAMEPILTAATAGTPEDFVLVGDYAFIAEGDAGLVSYDVSDPADIAGLFSLNGQIGDVDLSDATSVAVSGNFAFVTDPTAGILVVADVTDPSDLRYVDHMRLGAPQDAALNGDTLYVADATDGLHVIDVSVPVLPTLIRTVALPGVAAGEIMLTERTAVIGGGQGAAILDISDADDPRQMYVFSTPAAAGLASYAAGDLFVPIGAHGSLLMDTTNLAARQDYDGKGTFVTADGREIQIKARNAAVHAWSSMDDGSLMRLEIVPDNGGAKIKLKGDDGTTVHDVIVTGSLKQLQLKGVALGGDLTIAGTVEKLDLGDVADDHTLTIGAAGAAGQGVKMSMGSVADLTIDSQMGIDKLKVDRWIDAGGQADAISAPWIGKLQSKGDFEAALDLSGQGRFGSTLDKAKVKGTLDLGGGEWGIAGDVNKLDVSEWLRDGAIRVSGGIGKARIGGIRDADLLVSVGAGVDGLPEAADDFIAPRAAIGKLQIKGVDSPRAMINANVAAWSIDKFDVDGVATDNTDNDNATFGLAVRELGKYSRKGPFVKVKWKSGEAGPPDGAHDYVVRIV